MERHSFCMVSCELPKTMRKLYLSTKFPHQEIRWNYGIFHSEQFFETPLDHCSMSHVQRTFLNNNDLYLKINFCTCILNNCTVWKVSKYGVFSGLYFYVFSPNTEKYGPEKMPYLDTFHTVNCSGTMSHLGRISHISTHKNIVHL